MIAKIKYNPHTQKRKNGFQNVLTTDILTDICIKTTGQDKYIIEEDKTYSYNKGRLLTVEYDGMINFVTLSENDIRGRNSSMQSVSTALNLFYRHHTVNKRLCYYFIPYIGNPFTAYHLLYYRLMLTAGIIFLNLHTYYESPLFPYASVDEMIFERSANQNSNRSNNSSFITKTSDRVQLYAKTYGASKYESTVFGVALSAIAELPIDVFAVSENNLTSLPSSSLHTFEHLPNIKIYNTSLRLERLAGDPEESKKLRSAAYNFNLLNRLGMKKCVLCNCEIAEIIQGAHIWGVSEIRKSDFLTDDQKYSHATSAHNGLWLCQNHHKLFDTDLLGFNTTGQCLIPKRLPDVYTSYIRNSVIYPRLDPKIISQDFQYYLTQRNLGLNLSCYNVLDS